MATLLGRMLGQSTQKMVDPYVDVRGDWRARFESATRAIDALLASPAH